MDRDQVTLPDELIQLHEMTPTPFLELEVVEDHEHMV